MRWNRKSTANASWRADRERLLGLIFYAWDRARSPGVTQHLADGLARCGIEVIDPVGQAFDASEHHAVGVEITDDPTLVGMIAETEQVGFHDSDGTVLREPMVVVYRSR